ncbi:MAG TPA: hypothetical protein PKH31_07405 [Candidatus Sumerlaeota bacterium]|nr:hypothetical protein [Candidatus Sumerlaeota bacterium]
MLRISLSLGTGLLLALSLGGCESFTNYNKEMAGPQQLFASGNLPAARQEVVNRMSTDETRLNPWLELGVIDHTSGAFDNSNQALQKAADLVRTREQKAVVSLSETAAGAATLIVNEKSQPYPGEAFERVLIHTYLAMNYALQGDWEKARVEARRSWTRQQEIEETTQKQQAAARNEAARSKQKVDAASLGNELNRVYADQEGIAARELNAYRNAFSHVVSAVVYRANGDFNEAYVELKRAVELRPKAPVLGPLLIETAAAGGFQEDLPRWESQFQLRATDVLRVQKERPAELVIFFENGWAPRKEEIIVPLPTPVGIIKLAIPKYQPQPGFSRALTVEAGGQTATSTLLGDVEAQAVRSLRDRMPTYVIKMIVRITARTLAENELRKKAQKQGGDAGFILAFLFSSAVNIALEQADLRAWSLLPRDLQVARLRLPAGQTTVRLQLDGQANASREVPLNLKTGAPNVMLARSTGAALYVLPNPANATAPQAPGQAAPAK